MSHQSNLTNVEILLLEKNKGKDSSATCGNEQKGPGISCGGITCQDCPFWSDDSLTLGDLRAKHATYIAPKPRQPHAKPPIESPECAEEAPSTPQETQHVDDVNHPNHYMLFDDIEAIEVIARSMTAEMFRGYILGTVLKYRLRAGKKSEMAYGEKDLAKADAFAKLYEQHKGKCHEG